MGFLIPPHPLTNFETQKYYKNEPEKYVINLDEYKNVGTHWIALFCNKNTTIYFDNFIVEHIPKEIKKFIENKNIKANIFRVEENDSVMCGYFCIGFIDLC